MSLLRVLSNFDVSLGIIDQHLTAETIRCLRASCKTLMRVADATSRWGVPETRWVRPGMPRAFNASVSVDALVAQTPIPDGLASSTIINVHGQTWDTLFGTATAPGDGYRALEALVRRVATLACTAQIRLRVAAGGTLREYIDASADAAIETAYTSRIEVLVGTLFRRARDARHAASTFIVIGDMFWTRPGTSVSENSAVQELHATAETSSLHFKNIKNCPQGFRLVMYVAALANTHVPLSLAASPFASSILVSRALWGMESCKIMTARSGFQNGWFRAGFLMLLERALSAMDVLPITDLNTQTPFDDFSSSFRHIYIVEATGDVCVSTRRSREDAPYKDVFEEVGIERISFMELAKSARTRPFGFFTRAHARLDKLVARVRERVYSESGVSVKTPARRWSSDPAGRALVRAASDMTMHECRGYVRARSTMMMLNGACTRFDIAASTPTLDAYTDIMAEIFRAPSIGQSSIPFARARDGGNAKTAHAAIHACAMAISYMGVRNASKLNIVTAAMCAAATMPLEMHDMVMLPTRVTERAWFANLRTLMNNKTNAERWELVVDVHQKLSQLRVMDVLRNYTIVDTVAQFYVSAMAVAAAAGTETRALRLLNVDRGIIANVHVRELERVYGVSGGLADWA